MHYHNMTQEEFNDHLKWLKKLERKCFANNYVMAYTDMWQIVHIVEDLYAEVKELKSSMKAQ